MKIIERIKKNKFGKSVLIVAGGTAFAQLTHALITPVITRIYAPEEYGVLTAYITILGILSLSAFKYEMAIPIAKDDDTAVNVITLCVLVLGFYTLMLTIVLVTFGDILLESLGSSVLIKYSLLIPLGVFLSGLYKILRQWAFRKGDFKSIARTSVNQSVFGDLAKVAFGVTGFGSLGLILGGIIRESAGITVLFKKTIKDLRGVNFTINQEKIGYNSKRYRNFPIFNLPAHFLSTLSSKLPIIFITMYYGVNIVGFYGLANSIVKLPMRLIGMSVGDVFYSEAAKLGKKEPHKLKKLSDKLIRRLGLIGILPLLVLLFWGPYLFSFVFGSEWYEAGVYARIISVMLYLTLIFAPISRVYEVFEEQKKRLLIDVLKTTLATIAFIIAGLFNLTPYISVLAYSIIISLMQFLTYIIAQRIINNAILFSDSY